MAAAGLEDQRLLAKLVAAGARIDDPDPVLSSAIEIRSLRKRLLMAA
jgi:predicted subunit of tRNA(5-methylaminomethyl-2-thiouridylate) methyltransferase